MALDRGGPHLTVGRQAPRPDSKFGHTVTLRTSPAPNPVVTQANCLYRSGDEDDLPRHVTGLKLGERRSDVVERVAGLLPGNPEVRQRGLLPTVRLRGRRGASPRSGRTAPVDDATGDPIRLTGSLAKRSIKGAERFLLTVFERN